MSSDEQSDMEDYSGSDSENSYSLDEGEDDGIDEDYEDPSEHARKKQRGDKGKFALPTKEEQMHLRETENLMRTNLLKLQVDEMLAEIKDETHGNKHSFMEWISSLCDVIPRLGSGVSEPVDLSWLRGKGILGLTLDGCDSSKLSLRFHPPVSTSFIGSYLHKTSTKPFLCVDIAVAMSPQCFDSKDILNFAYFDKRKLYIGVLLQQLMLPENEERFGSSVYLTSLKGDSRKPIIIIKPNKKTPYLIRLHPTLPAEIDGFPLRLPQLKATKNNVRPTYWTQTLRENEKMRKDVLAAGGAKKGKSSKKISAEAQSQAEAYSSSHLDVSSLPPTTGYNMAILEDVTMTSVARAVSGAIAACPCIRDAILLMKVWLTQRGLRNGWDSMDGHEAAVLFLYLFSTKKILPQMSPLLAFTAALKFLVETRFETDVLAMGSARGSTGDAFSSLQTRPAAVLLMRVGERGVASAHTAEDMEVEDAAGVGFVDFNAFWRWSPSSVHQLQRAARRGLEILQHSADSSDFAFMELFIRKSNFFQDCDLYFHFPVLDRSIVLDSANRSKMGAAAESFEFSLARGVDDALCDLTPWQQAARTCHTSLQSALDGRAISIHVLSTPVAAVANVSDSSLLPEAGYNKGAYFPVWSPRHAQSISRDKSSCTHYVTVGIVLNREKSHQRVVKGPSAEDEAGCVQFRAFWGAKTQLRRFHDGTIVEACVFGSDAIQSGSQVPRGEIITTEIATYVLNRHIPYYCGEGIRPVCAQIESYLPAAPDPTSGVLPSITAGSSGPKPFYPALADSATLCRRAVEAVDALRAIVISKVEGMPLPVESFRAASPALRYSAFFPALSHPLVLTAGGEGKSVLKSHSGERISTMVHVLSVVLHMHRSGKWPADLDALRKVKTAMLIRLSESLKTQFQIRSVVSRDYLDVMFKGFVFRMRMFTENEVSLLAYNASTTKPSVPASASGDSGVAPAGSARPEVSADADALVRELVIAPLHHSAIHATHTENPCLGDTVRLLHRWMAGHLFSGHFDHETLELIAASVFLEAQRNGDHPQSATAGFLRSLRRIAEFEWGAKPLLVDFSAGEEMTAKDVAYIRSTFGLSSSGISKQLPMHIIASYDHQRGFAPGYGQVRPERVVLRMVVAAARLSVDLLSLWMARGDEPSDELQLDRIMNAPQPVASRFNVVVKLSRSVVSKAQTCGKSDGQNKWIAAMFGPSAFHTTLFSNLSASELSGGSLSLREGNVPNSIQADVFRQLSVKFGSYALFFWDEIAGDRIGIVWKPQAFLPQKFSLLESRLRLAVTDGKQSSAVAITVLNSAELLALMLNEFDGLVERVDYL